MNKYMALEDNYAAPGKKCSIMPPNGSDMFVIREIWLLPGYKAVL